MATLAADIVNRALAIIGGFNNNKPVTGNAPTFDSSPAAQAAGILYQPCVQTVARQFGYDFSRGIVTLSLSGNTAKLGFSFEYLYPTNGVQVRQLMPHADNDANNPLPQRWVVGNATVSSVPKKVIWTNIASADAVFTNQPPEDLWDAEFAEAVVRLLASELAPALQGKGETEATQFERFGEFAQVAEQRGES